MKIRNIHGLPGGRTGWLILVNLFAILLATSWAEADMTEKHRYQQQSGDKKEHFTWILENREGYLLRTVSLVEEHQTLMDTAMATRLWSLTNVETGTRIQARREGNRILLQGQRHGKTIERTLDIDQAPWFQALSFALRAFLAQPQPSTEFWTMRPDKLTAHKVRATKRGKELFALGGQQVVSEKVEISLTGPAAWLGRGYYWFRASDLVLLHYQGPSGLPGVPTTTITLAPSSSLGSGS